MNVSTTRGSSVLPPFAKDLKRLFVAQARSIRTVRRQSVKAIYN